MVEVDGDIHAEQIEYDARRTEWLNQQKHYRVIRFWNDEVLSHEGVLTRITELLDTADDV